MRPSQRAGLKRAGALAATIVLLALTSVATQAGAAPAPPTSSSFLSGLTTVTTVAPTTPANGDENPYAVDVAPVTSGRVHKGDILVDNFNSSSNRQGTGSTIVDVTPAGQVKPFADIPQDLKGCPGGIGLTTAFTMLKLGGWVIVGSAPSSGGSTKTAGAGCLIVLNSSGLVTGTISGPQIDGPWDMATADNGSTAALYITNTLFGVKAPGQAVVKKGTLLRIELAVSAAAPPRVTKETVIANGLPEQASAGAFVIGPTGVALIGGTAYVADPLANSITKVPDAATRSTSAGTGTRVSAGGLLHHPIAMVAAPGGDLVVTNGLNGDVVEVTASGKQVREFSVDPDPAQSPPGSGDLFGLAVAPSGRALYFAKDDTNTLAELS
jgi:hypothetical protein